MSKLLSICIPTYERKDLFELCIASLDSNIKDIEDETEIEIIISINDSSRIKHNILNKYKSLEKILVIHQNSENIGGDQNIINCYKKATGKYIWILGDDDYIHPKGVDYLLMKIKEKNPSCIFINSYGYKKSYNKKPYSLKSSLSLNFNEFISKISYRSTFISSIVVCNELIDFNSASLFEKASLYQLNLVLQTAKNGNNLYIGRYLVAARINHKYNYDFHKVFVDNYKHQLLLHLDKNIYKKVIAKTILLFYSQYLFHERLNNKLILNLMKFDTSLHDFLSYKIIRPIASLPRWVAIIYGFIVIVLSRVRYGDIILLISKLLVKFDITSREKI